MEAIVTAFLGSALMMETDLTPQALLFVTLIALLLAAIVAGVAGWAFGVWQSARTRSERLRRARSIAERERLLTARSKHLNRLLGIKDES